jgi:hypothetical protein
MLKPNGKHGVVDNGNIYTNLYEVIQDIDAWLKYCFKGGSTPPGTPTITREIKGSKMIFRVTAPAGGSSLKEARLHYATQIDSTPSTVNDFGSILLTYSGGKYVGSLTIGGFSPSGPAITADNIVFLASVKDGSNYTVTSRLYYRGGPMAFGQGFVPVIEHWYRDTLPVPPPPVCP